LLILVGDLNCTMMHGLTNLKLTVSHLTTIVFLYQKHQLEEGQITG